MMTDLEDQASKGADLNLNQSDIPLAKRPYCYIMADNKKAPDSPDHRIIEIEGALYRLGTLYDRQLFKSKIYFLYSFEAFSRILVYLLFIFK